MRKRIGNVFDQMAETSAHLIWFQKLRTVKGLSMLVLGLVVASAILAAGLQRFGYRGSAALADTVSYTPNANCSPQAVPVGQAWPSMEPEPQFPIWCYTLANEPTTAVAGANDWLDMFQTNVQMGSLEDGNMNYRVFNNLNNTGTANTSQSKSKHFVNNNHWMIDMTHDNNGAAIAPNKAFRFENGKLVIEADVAAGIPGYVDSGGGDIVWPEVDWSTSPQPTGNVVDGLYIYGQFGGSWASGCRMSAGRRLTCALEADHALSSVTNDQPPCFSVDPSRVWELSGFQQCGSTHFGGAVDFGAPSYAWRMCQPNQMDMFCRDRFRFEWTQNSLTVYVNGYLFFQDSGWPAASQIPTSIVNGSTPIYAYFGEWGDFSDSNVYRFHWQRLAVNPHDSSGNIVAPSAAPSFCLGQPQNTCPMDMPMPTTTAMPMPTMTVMATPTATKTPATNATPTATPATAPPTGADPAFGYAVAGSQIDTNDANFINGSRFTMGGTAGNVVSMSVFVGAVDASPNNQFQVAIYSDIGGSPGSLIAQSGSGALTPNAWNTLPVSANLSANTAYWLVYNTNGSNMDVNNMAFDTGGQDAYSSSGVPFGTWPTSFGPATLGNSQFSIYASFVPAIISTSTPTPIPPTRTPTMTPTKTPSASATATPTTMPNATATPTATPTKQPTSTKQPTATNTPDPTPTMTATPTPTPHHHHH